jgi:hypothetical protein
MLIKWGSIVVKGSGKLGGHVYTTTRTGATVRTNGTVKNPRSQFQKAVRGEFSILTQNWRQLTNVQRQSWRQAEEGFTRTNRFGDVVRLTGKNLYESLNYQRSIIGLVPLDIAPEPIQLGINSITSVEFKIGDATIVIQGRFEAQGQYVVIGTKPISPGVEYVENRTRILGVQPGAVDGNSIGDPADIYQLYANRFGDPRVNDRVFIGSYAINEIGQRTAASVVSVDVEQ